MIEAIIAKLDVEIALLQKARALLVSGGSKRGRPATTAFALPVQTLSGKKRVLSAETKERMRQGQLKRWAAARNGRKQTSGKTASR